MSVPELEGNVVTIKHFLAPVSSAALLLTLAACSAPNVRGVYVADFSTSQDPNVAMAGKLQRLSLKFDGKQVNLQVEALGQTQTAQKDAKFEGNKIVLSDPSARSEPRWVMLIKNEDTLECDSCPKGMPRLWRKVK
jgi:hypothetical protein